jgi:hypothetical protein
MQSEIIAIYCKTFNFSATAEIIKDIWMGVYKRKEQDVCNIYLVNFYFMILLYLQI